MVKTHQPNFNGGILGPGMYDRKDISKYASGVADAVNVFVMPQGGLENRAGTKLAGGHDTSTVDGHQWLVPFEFSVEDTYMLEFSDQVMRVLKDGSYILDSSLAGQSITAITDANPAQITMVNATAAANFTVGRLVYVYDPNGDHILGEQVLEVTAISSATISFTILDGTTVDTSAADWGTIGSGALLYEVYQVTSPYAIEDMPQTTFAQDIDKLYIAHDGYDPRELARIADDDWVFSAMTFEPGIDAPGSPAATAHVGSGSTTYKYKIAAIDADTGEESLPSAEASVTNDLSTAGNINRITFAAVTNAGRYRVYKENNGLFGFIGDTLGLQFDDENIVADTTTTPQQARNPFSTANDRPKRVSFVEQRLTFAATANNPQLVEMSNSKSPLNFNRAISPVDSDAVTFRMRSQRLNRVTAIVASDPHVVFTVGGEWKLFGGERDYIAPDNPVIRPISQYGSADYPAPLAIGETILHVLNNQRHIREMRPQENTPSAEVTVLIRHLLRGRTITSWAYAQNPDNVLYVTLDNGDLLTMTYIVEHEIWGWTRQVIGGSDVKVKQVSVVREGTRDVPYFVVERTLDSRTTTLVERLATRDFTEVTDAYFVDCGLTYSGTATATVSGLLHLRGESVAVLADGNVLDNITVNSKGQISLGVSAAKVHAGLAMTAWFDTLDIDLGVSPEMGTTHGSLKAASEVVVGVDRTRGIAAGRPAGTLNAVREFTGETPIPLTTGQYTIVVDGDMETNSQLRIYQEHPLPMTITGIAPKWDMEDGSY